MNKINELQKNSINNYKKYGIDIDVLDNDDVVIIKQSRLINNRILTNKELFEKGKKIFPNHKIRPVVYKVELDYVTPEWVKLKLDEFDIKPKDLSRQTSLDLSTISLILNGERKMNKSVKALFFYYFALFETHKSLDEYFEIS